ncbi:transcription initiation factor TFIID subunit 13-like [Juglans microcarpa x Juglans regia]|uniref:transcription initiation factor TFIID subunit 13-like n=1 Tax=Juglans microcarpa x Juglans regia TaxID=2249226 RepID=UPI001B7EBA43|nr:transcription initiation factor TFIID subunit 13-like [Juglans microcarpa x Juglans regia]
MITSSGGASSKSKAGSLQPSETSFKRKRGFFQKELQHMMYGFGDDPNPLLESVALVEDIVLECITDLVNKAQDIKSKRGKLSVEGFLYLIRKDLPKLNWCTELLSMNEELKQARKVFESDEEKLRKVLEADEETRWICVVVLFYLHLFILSGMVRFYGKSRPQ